MRRLLLSLSAFVLIVPSMWAAGNVDRANSTLHFNRIKSQNGSLFIESEEALQAVVDDTVVVTITKNGVTFNTTVTMGGIEYPPLGSNAPIIINNTVHLTQPLTINNIQAVSAPGNPTVLDVATPGTITLGGETGGDAGVEQVVVPENVTLTAPIINVTNIGNATYPQSNISINNNGITLGGSVTINKANLAIEGIPDASIPAASVDTEGAIYFGTTSHDFYLSNGTDNLRISATAGANRIPITNGSGTIPLSFLGGITSSQLSASANISDSQLAESYLKRSGGTMAGNIDLGGQKVTNSADPSAPTDLVTLQYLQGITGNTTQSSLLSGGYSGLEIYQTGNTTITVAASVLDVSDGSGSISLTSVSVVGDIATSGAGGLDTGSVQASTGYNVFIASMADGSSPCALFSTSATSPTLPGGRTRKRRVGKCATNGSSQLVPFYQIGNHFQYDDAISVLANGTSGSFTALPLSSVVPPGVRLIILNLGAQHDGAYKVVYVRPTGSSSVNGTSVMAGINPNHPGVQTICDSSQSIDYKSFQTNGFGAYISVEGWIDNL